jgi:Protein of unknown function (DUF4235)
LSKILFIPVSVIGGLLAGLIGKKAFDVTWGLIDEEEPPEPEHRDISWPRMIVALALQGAIFRAVRGLADHGARTAFYRSTGVWPGEEEPDPA